MASNSKIPEDILDDLSSRFIINIPKHERSDLNRISFQIELAHWFYLDYYCVQNPSLRPYKLKEFFYYIFQHIPYLKKYDNNLDGIYNDWREYKLMVPTFGAILLDDTLSSILLVQSYMATSWGFPKGKINEEEDPVDCACREVFEETGIDISKLINADDYVESTIHDQLIRLYFIVGIDRNATFEPQTRCEIKAVKWFPIEQLPISKKDIIYKSRAYEPRYFYMVIPFMKRIINWVEDRKRHAAALKHKKTDRSRNKSCSDTDCFSGKIKNKCQPPNDKRKHQQVNRVQLDPPTGYLNYFTSEILATEELQQNFDSLNIDNLNIDAKLSKSARRKMRNSQRSQNRKSKDTAGGVECWKNFRFNRDLVIQHLYN